MERRYGLAPLRDRYPPSPPGGVRLAIRSPVFPTENAGLSPARRTKPHWSNRKTPGSQPGEHGGSTRMRYQHPLYSDVIAACRAVTSVARVQVLPIQLEAPCPRGRSDRRQPAKLHKLVQLQSRALDRCEYVGYFHNLQVPGSSPGTVLRRRVAQLAEQQTIHAGVVQRSRSSHAGEMLR